MRLRSIPESIRFLGIFGAARYWGYLLLVAVDRKQRLVTVRSRSIRHPIAFRTGVSDRLVLQQVFFEREYACVEDLEDVELVIDCGANCGYTAIFFLNRFPGCRVIAVEPDPDTFRVLADNLRPYGERATALRRAVWSHATKLKLVSSYGDGDAWARQTQEASPGESAEVEAVDIPSLLATSGRERISLLKVDIEGAEAVVFAASRPWIDLVDNIVIELHDDTSFGDGGEVFRSAIAHRDFDTSQTRELTVCRAR